MGVVQVWWVQNVGSYYQQVEKIIRTSSKIGEQLSIYIGNNEGALASEPNCTHKLRAGCNALSQ